MSVFRYVDHDGDHLEIAGGAGLDAGRLTLWVGGRGKDSRFVYLSTQAADDLIDALQGWRGLRPQDVPAPAETPAAVATCLYCPHSPEAHSAGIGCRMCLCAIGSAEPLRSEHWCGHGHNHDRHTHNKMGASGPLECLGVQGDVYGQETGSEPEPEPEAVQTVPTMVQQLRAESLALAVQLHSRSSFQHDSGDHALDTAEEFSRWLLDGTRDLPAEPVTITPGLKIPLQANPDPQCPICRHAHHGAMHCGERNASAGDRTRCKCTGVAQA